MKYLFLTTLLCALTSAEMPPVSLEATVYGISYHTNREVDWNEVNQGVGLTLVVPFEVTGKGDSVITSIGTFLDSDSYQSKYALIGLRHTFWNAEEWHMNASVSAGYFDGAGQHGFGIIPIVSVGYNMVDICFTGGIDIPVTAPNVSSTKTSLIAAFLQLRLLTF